MERSVNFRMNLWSHRFSQSMNKKLSRFLPSLHRAEILIIFWEKRCFINSFWNCLTFTYFYNLVDHCSQNSTTLLPVGTLWYIFRWFKLWSSWWSTMVRWAVSSIINQNTFIVLMVPYYTLFGVATNHVVGSPR